jgi:hypothetical protein
MRSEKEKSKRATKVVLTEYKWTTGADKDGVHSSLSTLINDKKPQQKKRSDKIKGDRVTVIISTPKKWGASVSSHPGHCGIALWNSSTFEYQSFGICVDGSFCDEEVNVNHNEIKEDKDFKIWYFTRMIDPKAYEAMRTRMTSLGEKEIVYGKFFISRGWSEDGSYSCVTAVDTILVAGGLSKAIASLTSAPYPYAQTFSSATYYISYAENYKHM